VSRKKQLIAQVIFWILFITLCFIFKDKIPEDVNGQIRSDVISWEGNSVYDGYWEERTGHLFHTEGITYYIPAGMDSIKSEWIELSIKDSSWWSKADIDTLTLSSGKKVLYNNTTGSFFSLEGDNQDYSSWYTGDSATGEGIQYETDWGPSCQNFKVTFTITYNSITLQEAAYLEKAINIQHSEACTREVDLEKISWYPDHNIKIEGNYITFEDGSIDSVLTIDRDWYIDSSRIYTIPDVITPIWPDSTLLKSFERLLKLEARRDSLSKLIEEN